MPLSNAAIEIPGLLTSNCSQKTKQGTIDVYFQGDSITRRWGATDYPKLLAHWKKNFHGWNAANFAWGGDNTHNILWRMQNGELDGVSPKVIVLQAGTNNLPWSGPADDATVDEVSGGIKAILDEFQQRVPDATVILTAVFPRTQNMELAPTIHKINERIETLADGKRIRFLNINDQLADSTGRLLPGVSSDGLHLEEPGYEIWAQGLETDLPGNPWPARERRPRAATNRRSQCHSVALTESRSNVDNYHRLDKLRRVGQMG